VKKAETYNTSLEPPMNRRAIRSNQAGLHATFAASHLPLPRRAWFNRALVASAGLLLTACAQLPIGPSKSSINPVPLDAYMQQVEQDVRAGIIPGAVLLVARDGKVLYRKAVGKQDPRADKAMAVDSLFRIYSMTKPIVSVAALILIEEGKMGLADPVSQYLPELKNLKVGVEKLGADGKPTLDLVASRRDMTVHDLMRHMSGLTYGVFGSSLVKSEYVKADVRPGSGDLDYDNAELVRRVGKLPLAFQPGSTWDYSISTDVLGALVEKVSGQSLDVYLQRRILGPLKMNDTAFWVPPEKHGRIAEAFALDPDTKQAVPLFDTRKAPKLLAGGAGLVASADDYARFAHMLASGGTLDGARILSRKSVQWMTHDHTDGVRGPAYAPGAGYGFGLGVAVRLDNGQATIHGSKGDFHWGGYAGTFWWHDPVEKLVAVWMIQGPGRSRYYRPSMRSAVYSSLD
jgi:CubicO group peptidase (beta-lactamase class C family)